MKPEVSMTMIVAMIAAVLALTASPGHTQIREPWTGPGHPEQVLAASPQARQVWHAAVPPELRRQAWLYGLHGTAGEIGIVPIDGRRYITGSICKPHDCGPHMAAWLIALDHSRAAGVLDLNPDRAHGPRHFRFFGDPNGAERDQLLASLYSGGSRGR